MNNTKQQLRDTATKYNAIVTEQISGGDGDCINVEAPAGYVWLCDGNIHELVGWCGYGSTIPRADVYADLIDRMNYGVEKCTKPDCEWCNNK